MRSGAILGLCIATLLQGAAAGRALTVYDVDFGSPTHVVGSPPTSGAGAFPRATVSGIPFGAPAVVSSVGALDDQPLLFNGGVLLTLPDRYMEQIRFDLGLGADRYRITFDVVVDSLETAADAFVVLLDTPLVRTFELRGDDRVQVGGLALFPATYAEDTLISVQVDVLPALDRWALTIDGRLVYQESWAFDDLHSVRFNLFEYSVASGGPDERVALDNVRILALPEPAAALLAALGAAALVARRLLGDRIRARP